MDMKRSIRKWSALIAAIILYFVPLYRKAYQAYNDS